MPSQTDDAFAEVKARVDLVKVISEQVRLTKRNKDLWGLCPFHQEKTGSFSVSPAKQVFYCFGCGKGGDAITFLRELEHLSYVEAIERLASTAGVTLRYEGDSATERRAAERRKALYRANEQAATLFSTMLTSGKEAPKMAAAGNILYRVMVTGPLESRTLTTAPSGTMSPSALRTLSCLTASGSRRKAGSAWMFTCQVRPKRLKSLT